MDHPQQFWWPKEVFDKSPFSVIYRMLVVAFFLVHWAHDFPLLWSFVQFKSKEASAFSLCWDSTYHQIYLLSILRSSQVGRVNLKGDTAKKNYIRWEKSCQLFSLILWKKNSTRVPLCFFLLLGEVEGLWSNIDFIRSRPLWLLWSFHVFFWARRGAGAPDPKLSTRSAPNSTWFIIRTPFSLPMQSSSGLRLPSLADRIKVFGKAKGWEHLSSRSLNSTSFFSPPILSGHVKLLPVHPIRIEASVEEKDRGDKHQVDTGHPQTHVLML